MPLYSDPERNTIHALCRAYIATKAGGIIAPPVMDIHPVSGRCNLDFRWCIGRAMRTIVEPLPSVMDSRTLIAVLSKVLDPKWHHLCPGEFHFCGSDSEPLLAAEAVTDAIRFLLQRKRIVELITNGLLLGDARLREMVARIAKLHISLDVTNDEDYRKFKLPTGQSTVNGYTAVTDSIRRIRRDANELRSSLSITVSFVFIPDTFASEAWMDCVCELNEAGVNRIRVKDSFMCDREFLPPFFPRRWGIRNRRHKSLTCSITSVG
ncbi:MAG: hypothetical protein GX575_04445 [Candidatus Anammoximicrobium sp.]|nr:hypothetical protein [Candidatus Anammoximicrobium sp.]